MVLDFFLNAFVLKYFVVFFVLCANGCIVCVQKLPDLLTRILVFNVSLLQKKRMHQIPSLLINRINLRHK